MDYGRLGKTGLEVSRICLGCMSFGDPRLGREWVLDLDAALGDSDGAPALRPGDST